MKRYLLENLAKRLKVNALVALKQDKKVFYFLICQKGRTAYEEKCLY